MVSYKNWLITGGCGFIGTNLIKKLVQEGGFYIRIVDNLSVGTRDDLRAICKFDECKSHNIIPSPASVPPSETFVTLFVGDILDEDLALKVAQGMDVIVHLAANTGVAPSVENPRMDCRVNVLGTLNYLEAARHNDVKRFIFASSGAPIGEVTPPIHEEIVPHPVSPYGASKLAGEAYCSAYFKTFGLNTVALRFGNVYGPLSKHKNSVVAKFFRNALQGKTLEIYGDGSQTRDFIFIDDLLQAILLASEKDVGGEVFQIATFRETTVNEIAYKIKDIVEEALGIKVNIEHKDPRLGDVKRNYSDTSKAKKMLGWECRWDLEHGLRATAKWFLELRK